METFFNQEKQMDQLQHKLNKFNDAIEEQESSKEEVSCQNYNSRQIWLKQARHLNTAKHTQMRQIL